jgi:hypothetical protein
MQPVLERVRAGEEDPPCSQCGGILKSATISFGQALVPDVIDRAMETAAQADLFMAVGTSLRVNPVAELVLIAKDASDPGAGARSWFRHDVHTSSRRRTRELFADGNVSAEGRVKNGQYGDRAEVTQTRGRISPHKRGARRI